MDRFSTINAHARAEELRRYAHDARHAQGRPTSWMGRTVAVLFRALGLRHLSHLRHAARPGDWAPVSLTAASGKIIRTKAP